MFRLKLHIGDKVLVKKTNKVAEVNRIMYNPYSPWKRISSYKIIFNDDFSQFDYCDRKDLKKL